MNLCMTPHMNCVALAAAGRTVCTVHAFNKKLHPRELTAQEKRRQDREDNWHQPRPFPPESWLEG